METKYKNIVGKKFERLVVLELIPHPKGYKARCICDCGKETIVPCHRLYNGYTKSCGCLRRELSIKRGFKHGQAAPETKIYRTWIGMKLRCNNPNTFCYPRYGGRGIKIDPRWDSFFTFYEDMGDPPSPEYSLDRIDNDGDYTPRNCHWATRKEQSRNRRSTHWLTLNGETKSVSDWAEELGINKATLFGRLRLGWNDKDTLTIPLIRGKKHR